MEEIYLEWQRAIEGAREHQPLADHDAGTAQGLCTTLQGDSPSTPSYVGVGGTIYSTHTIEPITCYQGLGA